MTNLSNVTRFLLMLKIIYPPTKSSDINSGKENRLVQSEGVDVKVLDQSQLCLGTEVNPGWVFLRAGVVVSVWTMTPKFSNNEGRKRRGRHLITGTAENYRRRIKASPERIGR